MVSELIRLSRDVRIAASGSNAFAYSSGVIPENRVLKSLSHGDEMSKETLGWAETDVTSTPSSIQMILLKTSVPEPSTIETRAMRMLPVV